MRISEPFCIAALSLLSCCSSAGRFDSSEIECIRQTSGRGIMRVLRISDRDDSLRLRGQSRKVGPAMFRSPEYALLRERMSATMNDPTDPGVGIAAPQVGVPIRLIAVQRTDKTGEPFEFYADPRIVRRSKARIAGYEGCLSIPDTAGTVCRPRRIVLRYRDGDTFEKRKETVRGFASVIFQHEIDHLDGILFIDRMMPSGDEKPEDDTTDDRPQARIRTGHPSGRSR